MVGDVAHGRFSKPAVGSAPPNRWPFGKTCAAQVQLPPRNSPLRLGSPWVSLITLAAVFLVAFGVGTLLPRRGNAPAVDSLVQSPLPSDSHAGPAVLAQDAAHPTRGSNPPTRRISTWVI